ncbi:Hypothetical predicted protein [Paramuricea clavata]|uniref:Uncharacterized protein n=1 Tax=Paramuricea clavata TaxID=317549 RepID=A0A7D9DCE6_PARCT|nr:Hypothetical predicted protein [Paramuricea clavata]
MEATIVTVYVAMFDIDGKKSHVEEINNFHQIILLEEKGMQLLFGIRSLCAKLPSICISIFPWTSYPIGDEKVVFLTPILHPRSFQHECVR